MLHTASELAGFCEHGNKAPASRNAGNFWTIWVTVYPEEVCYTDLVIL